jgi:hypothetical protein
LRTIVQLTSFGEQKNHGLIISIFNFPSFAVIRTKLSPVQLKRIDWLITTRQTKVVANIHSQVINACLYCPVCPDPPEVANAEVSNGTVTVDSVRTYSCVGGIEPSGDPTVTCLGDTTWSEPSLICDGIYVLHYCTKCVYII